MSTSQTLIFVALPNGFSPQGNPRLSIYLTPRLAGGPDQQLSDYPDFLDWPTFLQKGLDFEIACGAATAVVKADVSGLRSDIWRAIFTPETYVSSYQYPDYGGRLIVSYPTRNFHDFLKLVYQTFPDNAARTFGVGETTRGELMPWDNPNSPYWGFAGLIPLVFRNGSQSTLASTLSTLRVTLWGEQNNPPPGTATFSPSNLSDTRLAGSQFALFHNLPPAPNAAPLPTAPGGFAQTLDFHQALTALSSYPSLLRALGLVFDLELPASFCPPSPGGSGYGNISAGNVTAASTWQITPQLCFPQTAYWLDASTFCAAPKAQMTSSAGGIYAALAAAQASASYTAGDVFGGFLGLPSTDFHLQQVDLDGAGLKMLGLADNFANSYELSYTPQTINGNPLPQPNVQPLGQALPALRTAGIALMPDDRARQLLASIQTNSQFDTALTSGSATPPTFSALDLVRGYRLDIWWSKTQQWHSLNRRSAVYRFGTGAELSLEVEEEGFTQLAAAQPTPDPTRPEDTTASQAGAPQPGTDIYLNERVALFQGWSLSAPRPGQPLNRSPDPAQALQSDPTLGQAVTPFQMTTDFTVTKGSLPALRFGDTYCMRVRAVDMAGNSPDFDATFPALPNPFTLPATAAPSKYFRFEPVGPPVVVLAQQTEPGSSLLQLVIRSDNSNPALDTVATTDTDQRHIAPPKCAVRMAEQHGMFDVNGGLNGAASVYNMIATRDRYVLPQQGQTPFYAGPQLPVGYFPDPIAAGVALKGLPNAPVGADGRTTLQGLAYTALPGVDARPYSVTYVDFGAKPWPNEQAFRLVLAEGTEPPSWNAATRVLTVFLPKAGTVQVPLSCFLLPANLENMGVWDWLRQFFEAQETNAMTAGLPLLPPLTDVSVTSATRVALEGGNEMITPALTLNLVHAVRQPLGQPTFLQLPVVHVPDAVIYASALRNLFTPVTAWRVAGSHDAVLLGGLHIHGASSAKVELTARWLEVSDNPKLPEPTQATEGQSVEMLDLGSLMDGSGTPPAWPIYAPGSPPRMVAVYIPATDVLWFAAPFDHLEGVPNPSATDVAAPIHHFQDTRHRWVEYTALATSRFQEYFAAPGAGFTRSSPMLVVDVPSSSRPVAPDIAYVVPTFGWTAQNVGNVKSNIRRGGGLRVYLNRGWYSSGQDELLGVVLWPGTVPADVQSAINTTSNANVFEAYKGLFTQWGNDPIWASAVPLSGPVPAIDDFANVAASATSLTLPEVTGDMVFDVVGYEVAFDASRKLWYCDIELDNSTGYAPFVRLALARYQPHSITGVELSPMQLADFVQIAPDRSAVLSINPNDPRLANLFVGGLAPTGPLLTVINVTVQVRDASINSDLAWQPAPVTDVTVTQDALTPVSGETLWKGSIAFAKMPPANQYRVVIQEMEIIPTDLNPTPSTSSVPVSTPPRLVYASFLPYNYP
jgi:hypothetical protein